MNRNRISDICGLLVIALVFSLAILSLLAQVKGSIKLDRENWICTKEESKSSPTMIGPAPGVRHEKICVEYSQKKGHQ